MPAASPLDALARELCDRHTGIGADGLILYDADADGASMRLFNADGSRAEVSGNGVRGLAALLLRDDDRGDAADRPSTREGGIKRLDAHRRATGARQTFRAAMGLPADLRQVSVDRRGRDAAARRDEHRQPAGVVLGPLPDDERFNAARAGARASPDVSRRGTNVEFAQVEAPDAVRILIWERGVGPTCSSGTGSCASLIAAAAFGGAARDADGHRPWRPQRVEWRDDSVYLTGWAEVLFDGEWLADSFRVPARASPTAEQFLQRRRRRAGGRRRTSRSCVDRRAVAARSRVRHLDRAEIIAAGRTLCALFARRSRRRDRLASVGEGAGGRARCFGGLELGARFVERRVGLGDRAGRRRRGRSPCC